MNWMNDLSTCPRARTAQYSSPRKPASRARQDPGASSSVLAQVLCRELQLHALAVLLRVSVQAQINSNENRFLSSELSIQIGQAL